MKLTIEVTTTYDGFGRHSETIRHGDLRTTLTYDNYGRVLASIDERGKATTNVYDSRGRQSGTLTPAGGGSTSNFDSHGRVESMADALGRLTSYIYDTAGRLWATIDPLLRALTNVYDSRDRVEATVDASDQRTTTVWDEYGRYSATVDALGNRTTTLYDAYGRAETVIDALGNRTTTVYDEYDRVRATVTPTGARTTNTYDVRGNLVEVQDPNSNRTTFVYDYFDRVVEEIDPLGNSTTFAYDAMWRTSSITDRLGRRIDFTYDAYGRKTGEAWYSATPALENLLTFTYDGAGNMLTAADYDGTYTMTYDDRGMVETVVDPWGVTLTFTYDDNGRRTKVEDSFGGVTTSVYDDSGNLEQRTFDDGTTYLDVLLGYNSRNQLASIARANSSSETEYLTTTYSYDAAGWVESIAHWYHNTNIGTFTYDWDEAGRLTSESLDGTPTTYAYDNSGQLTNDSVTTYTYDAAGNREDANYDTGAGNQLQTDGTYTYSYDDEGNLSKKSMGAEAETWFYGYDQRNQLIWIEKRAEDDPESTLQMRADYKYSAFGLRIEKTVDEDGDTDIDLTQRYTYDGWKTGPQNSFVGMENWDILADLDANNDVTNRYLRGDIVDQVFASVDDLGDPLWLLSDQLASVRFVVDETGVVKTEITYDGFGNIITETDAQFRGRYTHASREWDEESSHFYNRGRYYAPKTGTWITRDPIGFSAGDSNLYRYVNNRPTYATDPSGLEIIILNTYNRSSTESSAYGHAKIIVYNSTTGRGYEYDGDGPGVWDFETRRKVYEGKWMPTPTESPNEQHYGLVHPSATYNTKRFVIWRTLATYEAELLAVKDAFSRLNQVRFYSPTGPNSNTYAKEMLRLTRETLSSNYEIYKGGSYLVKRPGPANYVPEVPVPSWAIGWNYNSSLGYGGRYFAKDGTPTKEWDGFTKYYQGLRHRPYRSSTIPTDLPVQYGAPP